MRNWFAMFIYYYNSLVLSLDVKPLILQIISMAIRKFFFENFIKIMENIVNTSIIQNIRECRYYLFLQMSESYAILHKQIYKIN